MSDDEVDVDNIITPDGILLGVACRCGATATVFVTHEQAAKAQAYGMTGRDAARLLVDMLNLGLVQCDRCRAGAAN